MSLTFVISECILQSGRGGRNESRLKMLSNLRWWEELDVPYWLLLSSMIPTRHGKEWETARCAVLRSTADNPERNARRAWLFASPPFQHTPIFSAITEVYWQRKQ
jgi:hypothetical protein